MLVPTFVTAFRWGRDQISQDWDSSSLAFTIHVLHRPLKGLMTPSYVAVLACYGRPPLSRFGVSEVCRGLSTSSHNFRCTQHLPLKRRTEPLAPGATVGTVLACPMRMGLCGYHSQRKRFLSCALIDLASQVIG